MITRIPWTERRFEFTAPVGFYAEYIERMRGTPARIEDLVMGVPVKVLTRREGERWSIQENVGHLLSLEALWTGRLDDYLAGLDTLRAADMTNQATRDARYNEQPFGEVLGEFRHVRMAGVARLEALDPDAFGRAARHPRLGVPMRLIDMLDFQAHHDDFHLATMSDLLRTFAPR